jgi:6-phosphogluconolactonase
VFPWSEAFDTDALALAIPAPTHIEPHVARVTLNPRVLSVARSILVVATGGAKAAILREVLQGDRDPRRLPAQLARTGDATWIVDVAAASALAPS